MKLFGFTIFGSNKPVQRSRKEDATSLSKKEVTDNKISETALKNFMNCCNTIATICDSYTRKSKESDIESFSGSPLNRLIKKGDEFFTVGKVRWLFYSLFTSYANSQENINSLIGTLSHNQAAAIQAKNWCVFEGNIKAFEHLNSNFPKDIKGTKDYIDFLKISHDILKNEKSPTLNNLDYTKLFTDQLKVVEGIIRENSQIKDFENQYKSEFIDLLEPEVSEQTSSEQLVSGTFQVKDTTVFFSELSHSETVAKVQFLEKVEEIPQKKVIKKVKVKQQPTPNLLKNAFNEYNTLLDKIDKKFSEQLTKEERLQLIPEILFEMSSSLHEIEKLCKRNEPQTDQDKKRLDDIHTSHAEYRDGYFNEFFELFEKVYGKSLQSMSDEELNDLLTKLKTDPERESQLLDVCAAFANQIELDTEMLNMGVKEEFLMNVQQKIPNIEF